jgi:hypothetical protein
VRGLVLDALGVEELAEGGLGLDLAAHEGVVLAGGALLLLELRLDNLLDHLAAQHKGWKEGLGGKVRIMSCNWFGIRGLGSCVVGRESQDPVMQRPDTRR